MAALRNFEAGDVCSLEAVKVMFEVPAGGMFVVT